MKNEILKLINSYRAEEQVQDRNKDMPGIKVSKAATFMGSGYESIRNAIEESEEHLLKKRAIKRIAFRINAIKSIDTKRNAKRIIKEISWAKYIKPNQLPAAKTEDIDTILKKYVRLIQEYKIIWKKEPTKLLLDFMYDLLAYEIERIIEPHSARDSLVDLEYKFINNKGILTGSDLPNHLEPVQNYINVHRACLKSDNAIIAYHLFIFKFPFWDKPNLEQLKQVAYYLDQSVDEIKKNLYYFPQKRRFREFVRQSIPFKILDRVIEKNLNEAEVILDDGELLDQKIEEVCKEEYKANKKLLNRTIIGSIIYIFITKIALAFLIEVPYEIKVHGHINYVTLAINILFPTVTMFIVANSFSIPSKQNTIKIKDMIKAIISADEKDDKLAFDSGIELGDKSKVVFRAVYYSLSAFIFILILIILKSLEFNIVGMIIFLIFFSTIFFVANKIRNTASELKVVNTSPSIFSPIIDMFSIPVLILGKYLSESAAKFNLLALVMDRFVEKPIKGIIKTIDQWNDYLKDAKDELV